MFHIKQLELVHWDYWRRFSLPLDAQIITIVGPNGSGKTTLLDALRTLFGLRCSGKRDFRRYVRRANRSFAWIRAVVANRPGSAGKRPFFPCLKDEVTLACRIRRAGGDWTRDYAIADGDVPIEALEAREDKSIEWVGYRDYQARLAWGGLTPAIAKVLALEQGDTDKLCEYSPKALLELVFDVFGDKEVLDNYALAREEQNNAERELGALGLDLDRLRAQAEAKRLEADRFLEWKQLDDEARALATEIVPRLEATELTREIALTRDALARDSSELQRARDELETQQQRSAAVERERDAAERERKSARNAELEAEKAHLAAHDEVRDADKLIAERNALRARLAREAGDAAVDLEAAYAKADARLLHLQRQEREAIATFEEKTAQLRAARDSRGSPTDPEVLRFRARLKDAGIAHRALAEIVEVTDAGWQGAVEAVLRPYRHVLLLEREQDRHAAWALGEAERFRHFIVPELELAPPAPAGSLAEVIRFADAVPRWLTDLLGRIQRVEDADAARRLPRETEWITRDGYHRERRGARHLGKPAEFHFGELARKARMKQCEADMHSIDARLRELRPQLDAAKEEADALRARLHGIEAAQLLSARADAFSAAEAGLPAARARLTAAIGERADAKGAVEKLNERLRGIDIELDRRKRDIGGLARRVKELADAAAPAAANRPAASCACAGCAAACPPPGATPTPTPCSPSATATPAAPAPNSNASRSASPTATGSPTTPCSPSPPACAPTWPSANASTRNASATATPPARSPPKPVPPTSPSCAPPCASTARTCAPSASSPTWTWTARSRISRTTTAPCPPPASRCASTSTARAPSASTMAKPPAASRS
ncbi:ATP-binding protein [Zoogloea sp.]|uniref:ATP-binding protein n=1 Tax=Zoogloea sp. TaxID=49181 RepID=UPI0035ADEE6A